uniref:hypothetical protein n=1 Tax=Gelidibacter sp. TaxID=2018083 RepID=UPI0040492C5C
MKTKWYISTFIIVFTLLGICHTNISLPNQEIIVEFNDDKVTNDQSQNAIASIKQQLQDFGVDNIQVRQVSNGNFRIVYHSSVAVESIKMALSSSENLTKDISSFNLNHQKQSSDNNQKHYNLDVYEIQGISVDYDLTGTLTLETKYVYDRFVNSNDYSNVVDVNETIEDETLQIEFNRNRAIVLAIENTSHTIPEVRAGPISFSGNL